MQQVYVKLQENSKYLDSISFEPKDGYTQKYPITADDWYKLINYPTKCFLNENGAIVYPNQVPANQQEQDIYSLKQEIAQLKSANNSLVADNNSKDSQINDLNTRVGQLMLAIANQPQGGTK